MEFHEVPTFFSQIIFLFLDGKGTNATAEHPKCNRRYIYILAAVVIVPISPTPQINVHVYIRKINTKWKKSSGLQMAHHFGNFIIQHLDHLDHDLGRSFSLFKGNAGLVILLVDLVDSNVLTFPCFPF
mmetsp:Transcript_14870/g.18907  ORF Transcript_14870/g.18907 Transcript_14870/m.18907 type:complete len:128 (-) Transcript_14870:136-519(-)